MQAELDGKLEFAADAIGGGDEDGVGEALGVEGEEASEAADFAENMLVEGAASKAFDAVVGQDVAVGRDDRVIVAASCARPLVRRLVRRGGGAFMRSLRAIVRS